MSGRVGKASCEFNSEPVRKILMLRQLLTSSGGQLRMQLARRRRYYL